MQASETKLQQIIEGTKQYVVPLFQRAYSWKKRDWELLWSDIVELCSTDRPRSHFIGSIVTMPTTSIPEGVNKFLLIDGQQRLTTIFILLCVLRDKAKKSEQELAEEIDNTILVNPYKKGLDYYKLQPTQIDREAFYDIIKPEHESPKDKSDISQCYLFFDKKIRQNQFTIEKIKNTICNNLLLGSVVLSIDDDPYLVFESLNAKGKPLTQADLIRNYLFMKIHADEQESVHAEYWQPMQQLLEDNLTEFIRHYLTKFGVVVKKNEIYFEIKDRISRGDALSYLKDLHRYSEYYVNFLNPVREKNEKLRKYFIRINRLDVNTVYPFLLNCYDDWMQHRITEEEFINVLQIIENFILRRFVCNIQTQGLNRIFATLYSQVSRDTNLGHHGFVERLKLTLQNRDYPKDIEFRERLIDVKLYGSNRSEKAKLILESIEESFNHKEQVSFDNLSIEHIMPQTLNDWWKNHLGEDWQITHELTLHTLGNLTLTAYNSELSNDILSKKTNHFKNSHLEINKYLHNQVSWHREDIETRAKYLTDIIVKIWAYFGDESAQISQSDTLTGSKPRILYMFGNQYPVKSWRDVLENTLNMLADIEYETFEEIIKQFPRFVGWDEKDFRSARKLRNGAFVEVNLSAKNIYAFCIKALETAELSLDEWSVKTID